MKIELNLDNMEHLVEILDATEFLGKWLDVVIDRPLGSVHPMGKVIYPINYGYVPKTRAGDGLEQDAYIIGVQEAIGTYHGFCAALIKRNDDVEDKLVIVPNKDFAATLSDEVIIQKTAFIEQYFDISIVRI